MGAGDLLTDTIVNGLKVGGLAGKSGSKTPAASPLKSRIAKVNSSQKPCTYFSKTVGLTTPNEADDLIIIIIHAIFSDKRIFFAYHLIRIALLIAKRA